MIALRQPSILTLILIWLLTSPKLSFKTNVYVPPLNPVHENGFTDVPPDNVPGITLDIVYGGTPPVGNIVIEPNPDSQVPVVEKVYAKSVGLQSCVVNEPKVITSA